MMSDFLIIALILVLLSISVSLYSSLQKMKANLEISTSLFKPEHYYVESNLILSKSKRELLVEKVSDWIRERLATLDEYIPPAMQIDTWSPMCACDGGIPISEAPPSQRVVKYYGLANIPLKVYQGDSYNIILNLHLGIRTPTSGVEKVNVNRQGDKINLTVTASGTTKQYLEVEMMAAGFIVAGELKQKQPLFSNSLQYQWNCFFEKSGTHSFALVFRVVENPDFVSHVGRVEQTIKVAQIDHLTQRQVLVLATSAGILSGVLTLAEILKNLGIW
jgi:hypothetical protein